MHEHTTLHECLDLTDLYSTWEEEARLLIKFQLPCEHWKSHVTYFTTGIYCNLKGVLR